MSLGVVSEPAPVRTTTHDSVAARSSVLSRVWLLLVGVELALIYAPTLRWLVDRWTMSVWHNAHGLFIPPVIAYFVWYELRPLRGLPLDASRWGFLFLIAAMAMHVLDTGIHSQILSAVSLVVALPGLALLFLGRARTRAIAFPLAFSVFMLPIPLALTERVHLLLREFATAATAQLLPILGVGVYAEDTSLHLANGLLFVGDACSGFSTLYAACAVAALCAYSCTNARQRVLTLAAAVPVAIAANIVRVTLLAILVHWRGFGVLDTWIHQASGMLTFVLALPLLFWLASPSSRERQA